MKIVSILSVRFTMFLDLWTLPKSSIFQAYKYFASIGTKKRIISIFGHMCKLAGNLILLFLNLQAIGSVRLILRGRSKLGGFARSKLLKVNMYPFSYYWTSYIRLNPNGPIQSEKNRITAPTCFKIGPNMDNFRTKTGQRSQRGPNWVQPLSRLTLGDSP